MTDPVTCPHCRESLDIPAEFRGRDVRCASCQAVFTVPGDGPVSGPTPPAARPPDPFPRGREDRVAARPRPNNSGVWLLLLLTLLTAGGCVAGCLGLSRFVYFPKMHPYTSAEGGFRVEFPGDPSPAVTTTDAGAVTVTGQRLEQERYVVKRFKLSLKQRFAATEEVLGEVAAKELAEAGAGAETDREFTKHGGHDAIDVMAVTGQKPFGQRVTIVRCVRAGNTMYVILAQGANMQPQAWWVRKYFLSFELTAPPNPDPKDE
jgi:LSD1 subclass zinc finger protein